MIIYIHIYAYIHAHTCSGDCAALHKHKECDC